MVSFQEAGRAAVHDRQQHNHEQVFSGKTVTPSEKPQGQDSAFIALRKLHIACCLDNETALPIVEEMSYV